MSISNHSTTRKSWRSDAPIILPGWECHTGGSRSKPTVHRCRPKTGGCGLLTRTQDEPQKQQGRHHILQEESHLCGSLAHMLALAAGKQILTDRSSVTKKTRVIKKHTPFSLVKSQLKVCQRRQQQNTAQLSNKKHIDHFPKEHRQTSCDRLPFKSEKANITCQESSPSEDHRLTQF